MKHPFVFKAEKSIETILYIAQNVKQPTGPRIFKILYFADKSHLEKYGRFICGDRYIAMKHGPVPNGIFTILKSAQGDSFIPFADFNPVKKAFIIEEEFKIKPLRLAYLDFFSDSDLECLNEAIKNYGHLSFSQLTDLSYDQAWHLADENDCISIEQIIATLNNSDYLLDYLQEPCP